jgi:hypothetical protein
LNVDGNGRGCNELTGSFTNPADGKPVTAGAVATVTLTRA